MPHSRFSQLRVPFSDPGETYRAYSATSDVLAYRRCPLQYFTFRIRNYQPSLTVQLYFGIVTHQVLDLAFMHYRGLFGTPGMPSESDIADYFEQVNRRLRARRIWAPTRQREYALELLQRFNRIEGPSFYPRILDTECRLQARREGYILQGTVDVLAIAEDDRESVEIWDYKAGKCPSIGDPLYHQYVFQMRVYAALYEAQRGRRPRRAVLYFLGELGGDPPPVERPVNAVLQVDVSAESVEEAMNFFDETVREIERCRNEGRVDLALPPPLPPEGTCDACDLRWNCPLLLAHNRRYELRYP
ncbi:RecB family exonuclease [Ammonifex thiophilus]|nr:PD-(D/E)XK nuclease family protein [Ammonifex thiophilus]